MSPRFSVLAICLILKAYGRIIAPTSSQSAYLDKQALLDGVVYMLPCAATIGSVQQ
jgi:hypothetical protein